MHLLTARSLLVLCTLLLECRCCTAQSSARRRTGKKVATRRCARRRVPCLMQAVGQHPQGVQSSARLPDRPQQHLHLQRSALLPHFPLPLLLQRLVDRMTAERASSAWIPIHHRSSLGAHVAVMRGWRTSSAASWQQSTSKNRVGTWVGGMCAPRVDNSSTEPWQSA